MKAYCFANACLLPLFTSLKSDNYFHNYRKYLSVLPDIKEKEREHKTDESRESF
jgi:hypothetical protein